VALHKAPFTFPVICKPLEACGEDDAYDDDDDDDNAREGGVSFMMVVVMEMCVGYIIMHRYIGFPSIDGGGEGRGPSSRSPRTYASTRVCQSWRDHAQGEYYCSSTSSSSSSS